MTLNSTVRMPPRTRKVSPFRTGRYAGNGVSGPGRAKFSLPRTLKEVGLEVNVEDVAAETLDRVVEWQNVDTFSVFDIKALVDMYEVTELDAKVVTRDLVHLDLALLDVVRAQADEDSVSPLLSPVKV